MFSVPSHVGVKQPDLESLSGAGEVGRQVLAHLPRRVAHPIDHGPLRLVRKHRETLDLRAEPDAPCRQVQAGLPAVQWVMVAVADEGAYTGPVELRQPIDEAQLGPQAPVRSVIDVAGDQQGIHLLLEAEIDDVPVGVEGGAAQGIGDVGGSLVADALERAVQVQIGRVDEAESGHGQLVL